MTLMILVGEGKGCTRHLTNSLSTQPDDDDDDDDDDDSVAKTFSDLQMMLTMMLLMMTMMILVGEGNGCTRHLTNSLSTQPDDDDVDDDDVGAHLRSEGSCCGGSGVRPLLPSPSEVADAPR